MSMPKYSPKYEKPLLTPALEPLADLVKGVHAACKAVKQIGARDFDNLVDSIMQHGLIRPIEVNPKRLLVDGRCRILACHVAGVQINASDIIETLVPPWTIAASNNARRHLTLDQKAMAATDLLEAERKLAAKKKRDGAAIGNQIKKATLGTDSVPSKQPKATRALRAIEIIAQRQSVPREKLALADKVRKADPKLAAKVSQGVVSLRDAASKAGIHQMKKKAVTIAKPQATEAIVIDEEVPLVGSVFAVDKTIFQDRRTFIFERADGIRIIRDQQCVVVSHAAVNNSIFVYLRHSKWACTSADQSKLLLFQTKRDAETHAISQMTIAIAASLSDRSIW